jgi:hypothetical protein
MSLRASLLALCNTIMHKTFSYYTGLAPLMRSNPAVNYLIFNYLTRRLPRDGVYPELVSASLAMTTLTDLLLFKTMNLVLLISTQDNELCHTYVCSKQRTLTDLLLSKTVSFSVNILKMGVKWISVLFFYRFYLCYLSMKKV